MYEFFIFEVPSETNEREPHGSVLVIFFSQPFVDAAQIRSMIISLLGEKNTSADRVLLLGIESNADFFRRLVDSQDLQESVSRLVGGSPVNALWMGRDGKFHSYGADREYFGDKRFTARMQYHGLMTIFNTRSGIVGAKGQGYHYVVPSQAHSDKFIRTANVLTRGAEVAFTALFLVRYLPANGRHIYVDTAGISQVAYSLVALVQRLDPKFEAPTIDSFNSYQGLDCFTAVDEADSLFLISASTRGKLAPSLVERFKIGAQQCVTLFHLGEITHEHPVLCDITKREGDHGLGHGPAEIYSPDECVFCRHNVLKIEVRGDQFLPQTPETQRVNIRTEDAPKWLRRFISEFRGKGIIRCHHSEAAGTSLTREIFLKLDELFRKETDPNDSSSFLARLDRIIRQVTPMSLCEIRHLEDSASRCLAERIAKYCKDQNGSNIPVVSATGDVKPCSGTRLVASSAVVEGRSLASASRSLRTPEPNAIQYLVGIARPSDEGQLRKIRSSAQFGRLTAHDYDFRCVEEIYLPNRLSPWQREHALLESMQNYFAGKKEYENVIKERLLVLDQAKTQEGLQTTFWSTVDNRVLKLRPGFAFWEEHYAPSEATQAEVYFTIATVLHHMRSRTLVDPKFSLHQQEHQRSILDPQVFDRFNDGIIQAAVLRASEQRELDYSIRNDDSTDMKTLLSSVFTNMHSAQGEAALEFLVAIALDHLTLKKQDVREVVSGLLNANPPTSVRMFCEYILRTNE